VCFYKQGKITPIKANEGKALLKLLPEAWKRRQLERHRTHLTVDDVLRSTALKMTCGSAVTVFILGDHTIDEVGGTARFDDTTHDTPGAAKLTREDREGIARLLRLNTGT